MNSFFDFSSNSVVVPLLALAIAAALILGSLAIHGTHLARIGVRNAGRRRGRAALIIAGLMLSTMFISAALAVDDTISLAVKTVAVYNLGRVDEDVVGGDGHLSTYASHVGSVVTGIASSDPHIAGVAPSLVVPDVLIADATAREVRGGISAIGIVASHAGPLGALQSQSGAPAPVTGLSPGEIYLNTSTAQFLNARPGDTIYLYSSEWFGMRYQFTVKEIVSGGLLGDVPSLVMPLPQLQAISGLSNEINHVYIANQGNGLTGVNYSNQVSNLLDPYLPGNLHVDTVKLDGVRFALQAQDIFGRILGLFTLFAITVGLLLIFLIFVLLAAERRAELGMVRAIGMRRGHVVEMLLFEGSVYDFAAALLGVLAGLGLSVIIVKIVSPIIERIGFPLNISVQPSSLVVAFCLGFVVTLVTIGFATWTVSRMTVAAALRDLPEPYAPSPGLVDMLLAVASALPMLASQPKRAGAAWAALSLALITRGWLPLLVGIQIVRWGIATDDIQRFSVGFSVAVTGGALLVRALVIAMIRVALRLMRHSEPFVVMARANRALDRLTALGVGGALAIYWSLPFDTLSQFGFYRFGGGIQTFFAAGVMMVFGAVWALAPNLDLLLVPAGWLMVRVGRLRHVARIAISYPSLHRMRTGIGLSLFALVCFIMVVMACIASSVTQSYDNVPLQAAGYQVAGQPLFAPIGGVAQVGKDLAGSPAFSPSSLGISAISSATPLPLAILQPDAQNARWSVYPTSEIQGAFLDGVGLPLVARARGFTSDSAVWNAVRDHPGNVVIDSGALSPQDAVALGLKPPPALQPQQFISPPIAAGLPGLSSLESIKNPHASQSGNTALLTGLEAVATNPRALREVTLRLRNIVEGSGTIAPTPIWVADLRGSKAIRLTIVGIVDDSTGQRAGLFGSPSTFAPVETGLSGFGNEYYYFRLQPGADPRTTALKIGSHLLKYGFETTVLQDVLLGVSGPRVFISRVIVGLVGLTLLVGMAALAVTGSRSVVERRQQIGMLRALGFRRIYVQAIFLFESLLVGVVGTAIGLALGLILVRNVFAVNFFEAVDPGLTLVVPWRELLWICVAAVAASALASLLPALQAGRVAPADALRYE